MPISHRLSVDNIFDLDPVSTNLTAPVSDVKVQSPLDITLTTTTRSAGIQNFSDALTKLAIKKQANAIHNDTITAQLAAAYEQEMPGGLEPEAQFAYTRAVDLTTKRKVMQQMEDFLAIDGSEILHDERMDRKTRATSFKNQLLGLLNLGKGSISRANAAEMFSDMDATFDLVMSKANISLAKDKKQEVLATTAEAFRSTMNDNLKFMEQLAPKVSDTDKLGNELSPAQFAKNQKEFAAGWLAKHINSKWFNAAVKQIARTNTGAEIEDIKATGLAIVGDELLRRVAKNPEIVQEKLMADIIASVPGSIKGTTLQDEIDSQSEFGKKIDTINKEFKRTLKSTLDNLDKEETAADDARDDRIANHIQDGISDGSIKTKEEALAHARAINDPSDQRQVENHINKHFSGENKKDIGHPDFGPLVKYGAENFYDAATDRFDKAGFYAYAGEQGFKTSAIKIAVDEANPQTERGKRRKDFFDLTAIKALTTSFDNRLISTLKEYNLLAKYEKLTAKYGKDKISLSDPLIRKELGLTGEVGAKTRRILDAEIVLGSTLDALIRNNPDVPVWELVPQAQQLAQSIIQDMLDDKPFGTTIKELSKDKVKTDAEPKEAPEVDTAVGSKVKMLDTKKGLFSFDAKPREAFIKQAETELEAYDKAQQKLTEIRKEFKGASVAKKASIIAAYGDNPENLTVPSKIRDIAAIVNPDPAVRRHLATLHLSGLKKIEIGSKKKFADDRELKLTDTYNPWNSFKNFIKALPKKAAEAIQPTAKALAEAIQPTAKSVSKAASAGVAALALSTSQLEPKAVEDVLQKSGATKIKQGKDGVESLKDIDDRLLSFTKTFFNDENLQDVWGDEKVITSARRTPKNKYYKEKSGHSKGQALDVRIDGWKGTPKDLLLKKLKPSAENAGWTIVSSKAEKEYVVVKKKDSSKNQYWMKLTKGKETNFIEVVGGDQPHIHYHIDENNLEPGGKW